MNGMWSTALSVMVVAGLAASAVEAQERNPTRASARPSSLAMSCAQASALVASQGAVVLSTGPYTYDRYVSGGNFCALNESTDPAWVPTADTAQCFVGYRCRIGPPRASSR